MYFKIILIFLASLIYLISKPIIPARSRIKAFPGAEGFGSYAIGGRGGNVVCVTNLKDDGRGSLRQALNSFPGKPLTVIFRVSGLIKLKSNLKINRSNLTIAGQTSPGDGICLSGYSFIVNGATGIKDLNHGNIIIRYIRSRPGGTLASGLYGINIENVHDVMIDHCSFSWANEECVALYDVKNVSLQWCIISEGLYDAGHRKGKRGYGGVWGGQFVSFHHNLIANQHSRNVRFNGSRSHDTLALVDFRNNVIFNWRNANGSYGGEVELTGGKSQVNIINNYYLPGRATGIELKFVKATYNQTKATGFGLWYIRGNVMKGDRILTRNNLLGVDFSDIPKNFISGLIVDHPFFIEKYARIKSQTAQSTLESVIKSAGATFPKRDPVDSRICDEIIRERKNVNDTHTSGIINHPDQVGGWPAYNNIASPIDIDNDGIPDQWELKFGLNPRNPLDANFKIKGYTFLELYLNAIVGE